jgi:hypothetical protein
MEAILESKGIEVDVTREDCIKKRNQFFECVVEKKNELSKNATNEQWLKLSDSFNKIQIECFAQKGTEKCNSFYSFEDIKY